LRPQVYESGVFKPLWNREKDTIEMGHSYWQKTNHAVTLVGWGSVSVQGKAVPTWKILNSWGEDWGDSGYFHIRRGTDEIAVETMPVTIRFGGHKKGGRGPAVRAKPLLEQYEACIAAKSGSK